MSSDQWLQTLFGRKFTLDCGQHHTNEVSIDELAIVAARLPRYGGHTRWPYTVAQHSVLVCQRVRELMLMDNRVTLAIAQTTLWGLLHDAHEIYLGGDIIYPIKDHLRQCDQHEIDRIHKEFDNWLIRQLQLTHIDFSVVKMADLELLRTEASDLMENHVDNWVSRIPYSQLTRRIEPWHPDYAAERFREEYSSLQWWTGRQTQ